MEHVGMDSSYGAYLDRVPAYVLAVNNAMSLFGLNRRLRGAAMGYLAAFEMTSSTPARRCVFGIDLLGLGEPGRRYFDEHIEADAVHEQIASRDICAQLVEPEPHLADDVRFGAAVCMLVDGGAGGRTAAAWRTGASALRTSGQVRAA